jgi:hypothetical protein
MAVIVVGGVGKDAIVATAINFCHSQRRRHWCRWLNPTAAAVNNNRYCRRQRLPSPLHTVNNDNHQKPAVVVCCQRWQWRSLLMEAVVNGGRVNDGLC